MNELVAKYAPAWIDETGLPGLAWPPLYKRVKCARDDLAHTGTEAARAAELTTSLAVVLVEVLLQVANDKTRWEIKDFMVPNPTCAHEWQTVADVRRTMLVNDYSILPISGRGCGGAWPSVGATELATYLRTGSNAKPSRTLGDVIKGVGGSRLSLYYAKAVREDACIASLLTADGSVLPVVVTREVDDKFEIVGIVTAFDLL